MKDFSIRINSITEIRPDKFEYILTEVSDPEKWSIEWACSLLKNIRSMDGFRGFKKICFEAGERPEIVCFFSRDKRKF